MLRRLAVLVSKHHGSGMNQPADSAGVILQDLARVATGPAASSSGRGYASVASPVSVENKGDSTRPALDVLREKLTQG